MVSTYLSYNLVTKDMGASMNRVASENDVKRETDYFKANIGKITSVDGFMKDYRLYSYAMKSFGLEDMTYAKAFMKKVLESDLTDKNSFANRLADQKYRDFAAAFHFTSSTATAETSSQQDNVIAGYKNYLQQEEDNANTETAYYKSQIGSITSADALINNGRLYDYALKSVGLDPTAYTRSFMKSVLTSNPTDPTSFVNQLPTDTSARYQLKQKALSLAAAFNFNVDGSLSAGVSAQDATQLSNLTESYLTTVPSHVTKTAALLNNTYIQNAMANVKSVSDITTNSRLWGLVKTALGLDPGFLTSTFQNIVTSDTTVQNNYANQQGGSAWVAIANMFNFDASGNVPTGGTAMSSADLTKLQNKYLSNYDTSDNAADTKLYSYYQSNMNYVTSVNDVLNNSQLYNTALKSVGLDPTQESKFKIKQVLTSDPYDPKSLVNQMPDKRYLELAKSFNFDKDGNITTPRIAESQPEIMQMSKDYVFYQTRFKTGADATAAKTKATDEANYFSKQIESVGNVNQLLSDKRLVDFMLTSVNLDPKKVDISTLKQVFSSDLTDPKSFANRMGDSRYVKLAASFNFNKNGNVANMDGPGPMSRRALYETIDGYYNQTLETEEGNDNTGVRLALYFKRKAPTISSAYDILGDTALLQVFKTAFSLPDQFSSLNIDVQAAKVNHFLNLDDLNDPTKLNKFIDRFTALYDLQNAPSGSSGASAILSGGGGGGGISANTLFSISQLKLS